MIEVVGLRRGWEALTHLNLDDPTSRSHYIIPLNRENTRTIDRRGGTVLHSSRTNPSKMRKLPDHLVGEDFPVFQSTKGGIATKTWNLTGQVLANLSGLGIEHLIAIGGDDTLSYAAKLNELGVDSARRARLKPTVPKNLSKENEMTRTIEEKNKALVLEAFETLFNKRDYVAAERFWSSNYVQHSAHIPPGREGLFNMIKGLPDGLRYENGLMVANGAY